MGQRRYQKRCKSFLSNLDSSLQVQISTQKIKNDDLIIAIFNLYSKFLTSHKIGIFTVDYNYLDHKKRFLDDFYHKLEQLNDVEIVFRYPLFELENLGIIVHFSFDSKSKFFDM